MVKKILNIILPIVLGFGILWWMYRNFDFQGIADTLWHGMRWDWMLFSLVFGVTAQLFRGWRWRLSLEPLGEHPRMRHCVWAVFISYAVSLVIPRIGEVVRCGLLKRYDSVSFPRAIGTVVTERIIDSLLILLMVGVTFVMQINVFLDFFSHTGTNINSWFSSFTTTGWLVTILCLVVTVSFLVYVIHHYTFWAKVRNTLSGVKDGILSLRHVRNKLLFTLYTLGIWGSYFLHFYFTFYCFPFTEHLGMMTAMVAFIVGSIAVIVPTPNGLGPWHFTVKTILVLYGVEATAAETFVLIVHTVQTALIPVLGMVGMIALGLSKKKDAANIVKECL